jgi:D-beta-D-heptose 7-phosphate kinase/D-beta-D-heptose 1-phosphate adenosyltransferase
LLEELGVDTRAVLRVPGRPTTHKTRVVARRQQIVRIDRETDEPLPEPAVSRLLTAVTAALPKVDGVVLEDYAKGLLSVEVGRPIMREAAGAELPVSVDPKLDLAPFVGAALIKPNLPEAEALSGLRVRGEGDLEAVARRLQKLVGGADVAITRGGEGLVVFDGAGPGVAVPTVYQEVFDVQGAGDTIIAVLSLAQRVGATLWEAAVLANAAAAVVVGKTGTATANREELLRALPAVREAALAARASAGGNS